VSPGVTEAVETSRDDEGTSWEIRRDGAVLGTASAGVRRGGPLVNRLDVPVADAAVSFDAVLEALRRRGEESVALDVRTDDPVLSAAVDGRGLTLGATQMLLDLAVPVAEPPRVTLRPMGAEEFVAYRAHLVTGYAQDLVDSGAVTDPAAALEASEESTQDLLPDGVDSPGQHLWTPYAGDVPLGILWVFVEGTHAFIYDIEVAEEQRRRGYGREILDAAARAAGDLGALELGLNVFGFNEGARALYERAGYATTQRTYRIRC
jgi:ribosomal protein S18 acetylase RimI-like enzyme